MAADTELRFQLLDAGIKVPLVAESEQAPYSLTGSFGLRYAHFSDDAHVLYATIGPATADVHLHTVENRGCRVE